MDRESLRICMISIHSSPMGEIGTRDTGGMSVFLLETAGRIARMGHLVDLITMAGQGEDTTVKNIDDNLRLVALSNNHLETLTKKNLLNSLPDIYLIFMQFIKEQKVRYSVIHSHYWLSGVLGRKVCGELGIPHIISFHTLGLVKNKACGSCEEPEVRIKHEKQLVQHCHQVVCFTKAEKNDLAALYDADTEKVQIIPCGVDQELFKPLVAGCSVPNLMSPNPGPVLLYVGRFVKIKGVEVMLKALSLLRNHQFNLNLVGGDDEQSEEYRRIKREIQLHELDDKVFFVGRVAHKKLPAYYSSADGVIVPSLHESFGLVPLEALSCGRPVIGSDVGSMSDVLMGGNGEAVQPGDVYTLAQKIEHMFIKKTVPLQTEQSIRRSVAEYDWQNTAVKLLKDYERQNTNMGAEL